MASKSSSKSLSKAATKALALFEDSRNFHDDFCRKVENRYKSYRGILEISSEAAQWTSKLHPPYINHIVETTISALVDDKLAYRVKPRPRFYNPGEFEQARQGARAHEILHGYQLSRDRFNEKQRPFALQNAIAGLTVAKNYWRNDVRSRKRLEVVDVGAELGLPGQLYDLREEERAETAFDGPVTEVVNIYDFGWHESAVELQRSPVIWHRVWMHINELRRLEKAGVYKNVSELGETRSFQSEYDDRETTSNRQRTKDMVEVLEIWYFHEDGKIHVVTLGNRKVELREDRVNPFWHGEYPFVVCSTQPDLFRVQGLSQVEKIAHLQEAAWDIMNQRIDNLRLLNNAIIIENVGLTGVQDRDFGPGEHWLVEGSPQESVHMWTPNPVPAEVSLPAEQIIKTDMQNLAGGHPFTSTSEARGIGADTATEAALVTNLAQRSTIAMKHQLHYAYQRIGQQRTELNQQFIRRSVMVEQIGLDANPEFQEIAPYLLQGEFDFDISPMVESLMRTERRAEANAKLQMALQAAPVVMALAQVGAATPMNVDEYIRDWLESYDAGDIDRFFSKKAPPAQVPGQGGQQQPSPEQQGPGGVTAQQSIDPSVSPSAQASLSPETMLARLGAMKGGINNLG